jgi:hypothetical protein
MWLSNELQGDGEILVRPHHPVRGSSPTSVSVRTYFEGIGRIRYLLVGT